MGATDLRVVYKDSISAADTVAASKRVDTVWSSTMNIAGATTIDFYKALSAWESQADTNWVNDTFFVYFQTSWDGSTWLTYKIDTLLATTAGSADEFRLKSSDSSYGDLARLMLIHWDSLEVAAPGLLGNVYYKECELWLSIKK